MRRSGKVLQIFGYINLTPRLSGGTRESQGLLNRFLAGTYFSISCMIFRTYPEILFLTNF